MVEGQLRARGLADPRVLRAMERVPRHLFVPDKVRGMAYADGPLPIGHGQTISQPYMVAYMTEVLQAGPGSRVLEVGTGSGYQTAVLAEMGMEVFTIEFVEELSRQARCTLEGLGYGNIHYKTGDGRLGWPEEAPFDGIIVAAAPTALPSPLGDQLAPGARLVIPIGRWEQCLMTYQRDDDGNLSASRLFPVRFVPLV